MRLFYILISVILGLCFFKINFIVGIITSLIFLSFAFIKLPKKRSLIYLAIIISCAGISKIPFENNNNENIYSGIVIESKENYFLFQSGLEKFYIYEKENSREVGDVLCVEAKPQKLEITSYESRFNFKEYLENKGVKRSLSSNKINIKFSNPFKLKKYKKNFLSNFDDESKYLISSLLFMDVDYESDHSKLADKLNIISLLTVSGIYLNLLLIIFKKIFGFLTNEKLKEILPYLVLMPYGMFVFTKLGIRRIFIVGIFSYINKYLLKSKMSRLTIVSLVALLFLLFDFHIAYQSSFYIGFGLSIIICLTYLLSKRINKKYKKIMITGIVTLFLIPLTSFKNGMFLPLNALLNNLLLPFNQITFLLSYLSFITTIPFKNVLWFLCMVNYKAIDIFSSVYLSIPTSDIFTSFFPLYYIVVIGSFYLLEVHRIKHLFLINIPIISLFLISFIPIKHVFNAVYFVNVGQGDCIIFKNNDKAVMIDTGGNTNFDIAEECLIPFLRKKQIYQLDALVITHNDKDHSGGVSSLMKNYKVNKFLANNYDFPYRVGEIYLNNLNTYKADNENDSSLVFNIEFMNKKWLLMGDASVEVEKYLLATNTDISCDILKVGHHGSKTSTSEEFLKKAKPETAIISVGEKNSYNHPEKEVVERLEKYNILIRRTDKEGTISFISI